MEGFVCETTSSQIRSCVELEDNFNIKVFVQLNMTFSTELVVVHTTSSMVGKFQVHVWRLCEGLNEENILCRFIVLSNSFWNA